MRSKTRNAVDREVSRVRIPNAPPQSPVNKRVCRTFLFCPLLKIALKSWKAHAAFWKELSNFLTFRCFEPTKSVCFTIARNFGPFAAEIHRLRQYHSVYHCLRRGQFGSVVKVSIDICCRAEIRMPQPILNLLERYAVSKLAPLSTFTPCGISPSTMNMVLLIGVDSSVSASTIFNFSACISFTSLPILSSDFP